MSDKETIERLRAEIAHRAQIDAEDMQRIQGWAGNLYEENQALRQALAKIWSITHEARGTAANKVGRIQGVARPFIDEAHL